MNAANKKHEPWQSDSLSVEIYSQEVAMQKLQYINLNPVIAKVKLSTNDFDYQNSSACFYETGVDDFGFLINLFKGFYGD